MAALSMESPRPSGVLTVLNVRAVSNANNAKAKQAASQRVLHLSESMTVMNTSLSSSELTAHAHEWVRAWNRRDIDAVLSTFSEDAVFVSSLAQAYTGGSSRVEGKSALRRYWTEALAARPELQFELIAAICDAGSQTLALHYIAAFGGKRTRACEIMRFESGKVIYGEALYGAPV
jgi:ketosteroid isomerase-like protein